MLNGLEVAGLPNTAIQLVTTTDRAAVGEMLNMRGVIDVLIPRGGKSLTSRIADDAKVPVIKHLDGVCHVYVDGAANLDMATRIADNAKKRNVTFPATPWKRCLLIAKLRLRFCRRLRASTSAKSVEMRVCPAAMASSWQHWHHLHACDGARLVHGVLGTDYCNTNS
jgi:glutamate-5-semialdehyde dehydrogenase